MGRERRAPEAVSRPRAHAAFAPPASGAAQPPAPGPHRSDCPLTVPHPAWSLPHLTSFILAAPSPFRSDSEQNPTTERRPATNMNGRKHLLPGFRRKERAYRCGRTAESFFLACMKSLSKAQCPLCLLFHQKQDYYLSDWLCSLAVKLENNCLLYDSTSVSIYINICTLILKESV